MIQKYMSDKEFNARLKQIRQINETKEKYRKLKEESNKVKKPFPKISTSKLVLWAMVILVFSITIWFMYESHRLGDLTQSYALLGIVASLIPVMWGYFSKSKAENTAGGIIYETAINNMQNNSNIGNQNSVG